MEYDIIKLLGEVAGIGGVALGVFPVLFRNIIRRLAPAEAHPLLRVSTGMVWVVVFAGGLLFVYAQAVEQHRPGSLEQTSPDKRPILGRSPRPCPSPSAFIRFG
jgi:hypothetical protein